jgi:glutamate N-acetyltransferase/amino-acid N-acetyltransferase
LATDPNWGRIAAAAGRAGITFDQSDLRVQLGDFLLMEHGQPLDFDRAAASAYLTAATQGEYLKTDTVAIQVTVGDGPATVRPGAATQLRLRQDQRRIHDLATAIAGVRSVA